MAGKEEVPGKPEINDFNVSITKLAVPVGHKLCPMLSQMALTSPGGFAKSEPKVMVFSIACAGKQCGMYNQCKNLKAGDKDADTNV